MESGKKKILIGSGSLFLIVLMVLSSSEFLFLKRDDNNPVKERKEEEKINKNIDTDGDNLSDYLELAIGIDPAKVDTDGDIYRDEEEVKNGYSPLIAAPAGKYLPEEFEVLKEKIKNADMLFYDKIFNSRITPAPLVDPFNSASPAPVSAALSGPAVLKEEVFLSNKNWKYAFYVPADIDLEKEQKLLIGYHGLEEKAADYIKLWQSEADKNGFIVAVLQAYPEVYPSGNVVESYPWLAISDFTNAVLANIKRNYKIGEDKIFLTGYSAGASSAYIAALDSGIKIKGVVPIDGYLPLEAGIFNKLNKARDVNFYVVHGANDTGVKAAINQEKILLQYGAKMEFKTLKGFGHEYPIGEQENIGKWIKGLM